jgi:ABC-type transport system involved in Fe-S cluster assembly fused permease/ATPase subunit
MELVSLGFAIMFSIIGFIVIYLKKRSDKFEYVFESFEYILLISAPLIVGASLVTDNLIKNYFAGAYFIAIVCWLIFWLFIKKWGVQKSTRKRNQREDWQEHLQLVCLLGF